MEGDLTHSPSNCQELSQHLVCLFALQGLEVLLGHIWEWVNMAFLSQITSSN